MCEKGNVCGDNAMSQPDPCPGGFYCPSTGLSAPTPCPGGFFCGVTNGSNPDSITGTCEPGHYCPAQSTSPKQNVCRSGNFCPWGSAKMIPCPAGKFCAGTGLSTTTGECADGAQCEDGASVSNLPCPLGFSCIKGRVTSCVIGSFCAGKPMEKCPIGSFCPSVQMSAPTPCTPGYYCATTGLTAVTAACPAATFCAQGSQRPSACPIGSVCGQPAMAAAVQCPPGAQCSALSANSCPAGSYAFGNATGCLLCPRGLYSSAPSTCRGGWGVSLFFNLHASVIIFQSSVFILYSSISILVHSLFFNLHS